MKEILHEGWFAMPSLVLVCIVIVTLAFVALVTTTILALIRLGESAARLTTAAQDSMAQVERIVHDSQELLAAAREMMPPAQRVVTRFQQLGERAADLTTAVLDEIEPPVLAAVAVARGVQTGSTHLLGLLTRRFASRHSSNNGDQDHDGDSSGQ